jgi:hypothetical protein
MTLNELIGYGVMLGLFISIGVMMWVISRR